jgi:CheY-like chemotaxis protein
MPGRGPGDPADILLIEDDPGDALMVRESFAAANSGSRFHVIPDGHRALRFLRRAGEYAGAPRPALILLDPHLPDLAGLDILTQIKTDPALAIIPVIVLSSSSDPADITAAYARHANAYITKPADLDSYDDLVKQIEGCFLGLITPPPRPRTARPARRDRRTPARGVRPGPCGPFPRGSPTPPGAAGGTRSTTAERAGPGLRPAPHAARTRAEPSNRPHRPG